MTLHAITKYESTCNMLRLQLACAFLFSITIITHAVTPISVPEKQDSHNIMSSAPVAHGHITTIVTPAAAAPETGSLSDFSALVAGAVADLQQKAEEAKKELAPEIAQLKEKEQEAAQAFRAVQTEAALKLQPELDKFNVQQEQLRSEAAKAASILGQEFNKVKPVIGRQFRKVKKSLKPLVAQLKASAADISQQISQSAADAGQKLQKQMPGGLQQAVAAAEKALKEDVLADLEKIKPAVESVKEEIQKNAEFLKQWQQPQNLPQAESSEQKLVQPWDAVEAEVRADVERMGKMFSEHVQRLQTVRACLCFVCVSVCVHVLVSPSLFRLHVSSFSLALASNLRSKATRALSSSVAFQPIPTPSPCCRRSS